MVKEDYIVLITTSSKNPYVTSFLLYLKGENPTMCHMYPNISLNPVSDFNNEGVFYLCISSLLKSYEYTRLKLYFSFKVR